MDSLYYICRELGNDQEDFDLQLIYSTYTWISAAATDAAILEMYSEDSRTKVDWKEEGF